MMRVLPFLILLFSACSSQQVVSECQHMIKEPKYSTHKDVGEAIKAQSQGLSMETLYIIFAADWCEACNRLFHLLKEAKIDKRVIFVDIERTWGFLFSREMGAKGVPTLAVINSNKTIQIKAGLGNIMEYLTSRLGRDKKIKLIQGTN